VRNQFRFDSTEKPASFLFHDLIDNGNNR
jgi:hypothetical protein